MKYSILNLYNADEGDVANAWMLKEKRMVTRKCTFLLILVAVLSFLWANPLAARPITHWSIGSDNITIQVAVGDNETDDNGTPVAFTAKGVDYGVVPINDNGKSEPYQDYFWGDPAHLTYGLIWFRDVGSKDMLPDRPYDGWLRQLGANSIRTYAWWKHTPTDPISHANNAPLWKTLDWSVSPRMKYGDAKAPAGFAPYPAHDGHDLFLDLCWNNGRDPIYVLIGIGIDKSYAFPMTNPATNPSWYDTQQFMLKTAQWLAQKYGNHPAVMGFVIGNETNAADTTPYLEYWQYLNTMHQTVKQYARHKLTLSAFQDDEGIYTKQLTQHSTKKNIYVAPDGNLTTINGGGYRQATPVDAYALDAWGFNPYSDPSAPGNVIPNFKDYVIDGKYATPVNPKPKPLLLTEWGAPASRHTSTPVSFPDPPNSSIVEDAPSDNATPASYHGAKGYQAAKVIQGIGEVINNHLTTNGGILSGGYVFEYADEWWKNNPNNNAATLYSHDANSAENTWGTGDSQFKSYWDEEWFGLLSTAPNPHRVPNGAAGDPVVNQWGWLNGGADVLTPRAGFYALQTLFKGFSDAPVTPTEPPQLDPLNMVQGELGSPLFHWIVAENSPSHYDATGLPEGLSIDAAQGVVHGTLAASGIHDIYVKAHNEVGKDKQHLLLYVDPSPPEITNSGAKVKVYLNKKITKRFKVKTNDASAKIEAWGLPAALTIDEDTGLLRGVPREAGTFVVKTKATNDAGSGRGKFTLIVLP